MRRFKLAGMVIFMTLLCLSKLFAIESIDTKYTMIMVRTAVSGDSTYIVGSSYEGVVMGVSFSGEILWENKLSGYMNHDIWCEDITGDGNAEVMAANADGNLYCLNHLGELQWQFKRNSAPLMSVCAVKGSDNTQYVVCGGFDKHIYYLSPTGDLVKSVSSKSYSNSSFSTSWNSMHYGNEHVTNYLRKLPQADGSEHLLMHGVNRHIDKGHLYQFEPLGTTELSSWSLYDANLGIFAGALRVADPDGDGNSEVLLGGSGWYQSDATGRYNMVTKTYTRFGLANYLLDNGGINFGYPIAYTDYIKEGSSFKYFTLYRNKIFLIPPDFGTDGTEIIEGYHAYYGMWHDTLTNKVVLASAQSGGSCIHVIDPADANWKNDFKNLAPPGKMADIKTNIDSSKSYTDTYEPLTWERKPLPVYMFKRSETNADLIDAMHESNRSPVFIKNLETMAREKQDWRSASETYVSHSDYRIKTDDRMSYSLEQQEVLDRTVPNFDGRRGITFWGGHGNDPLYYQPSTYEKIIAGGKGKQTCFIWPEIYGGNPTFEFVLDYLFYPLGEYAENKNGKVYFRSKAPMWFAVVHNPIWEGFRSGRYADVFVTSHEETGAKIADLSFPGRQGMWASGVVNELGARSVPDMVRYHGMRTHCDLKLPSSSLRYSVYNISSGATYINNLGDELDPHLWELINKGVLYIPKREEIVSYSPVHLGMKEVNPQIISEVNILKWNVFYNEQFENDNPAVFSRINDSWPGAPVTDWDFTRYAAGMKDRRTHFVPHYNNGLVLIAPVQNGIFSDSTLPRGKMVDNLHPIYKDIMQEFVTDGKDYFSADGTQKYNPTSYYTTVKQAIEEKSELLPLTVKGQAGWVCAQNAPKHLRLTLVDGGYMNPNKQTVKVVFHTVTPVSIKDILSGETFTVVDDTLTIDVPAGLYRFLDIELTEVFGEDNSEPAFTDVNGIINKANAGFNVNYSDSLTGDVVDPDGDELTFTKVSGPYWLEVSTNGQLSGIPSLQDKGINAFKVRAADSKGKYDDVMVYVLVEKNAANSVNYSIDMNAYVRNGVHADVNYSSSEVLDVKTDSTYIDYAREAYLKFDFRNMAAVQEPIEKYILKLTVKSVNYAGSNHVAYSIVDDTWDAATVTWNTKPLIGAILDTVVTGADGSWVEFDITEAVVGELAGDSILSLAVIALDNKHTSYYSGESSESGFEPRIIAFPRVGGTNTSPVWSTEKLSLQSALLNEPYSVSIASQASDADGDVLKFFIDDGPKWLRISHDGILSGTPDEYDNGDNCWVIKVADGISEPAYIDLEIKVSRTNTPPRFTQESFVADSAVTGKAYVFTLPHMVSDPDANEIEYYTIVEGPAWLSIGGSNRVLTGTPAIDDIGENVFLVRVTDAIGDSDTIRLTVNVKEYISGFSVNTAKYKVYPNPTPGIINVVAFDVVKLDILNLSGQVVHSEQLFGGTSTVELSYLPTGMYLIRLSTNSNQWIRRLELISD